jgi:hypothetical protein
MSYKIPDNKPRFRTWLEWSLANRCEKCHQIIKPSMQGLMDMGKYMHDTYECPMKNAPRTKSCPHCGKDLEI